MSYGGRINALIKGYIYVIGIHENWLQIVFIFKKY